jgi:hypothetical protein
MEYGFSANDATPVEVGKWMFLVGQAEPWISETDNTTGCLFWKQGVQAARAFADKFRTYHVHPQHGSDQSALRATIHPLLEDRLHILQFGIVYSHGPRSTFCGRQAKANYATRQCTTAMSEAASERPFRPT